MWAGFLGNDQGIEPELRSTEIGPCRLEARSRHDQPGRDDLGSDCELAPGQARREWSGDGPKPGERVEAPSTAAAEGGASRATRSPGRTPASQSTSAATRLRAASSSRQVQRMRSVHDRGPGRDAGGFRLGFEGGRQPRGIGQ